MVYLKKLWYLRSSAKCMRRVSGVPFEIFDKMGDVFEPQSKRDLRDGVVRIKQQPFGLCYQVFAYYHRCGLTG